MAKPKSGEIYHLVGETIGVDPGSVRTGAIGKVREIVSADEPGAHNDIEDAVVLEFDEPVVVYDDNGNPALGVNTRAVSFGLDFFSENFKKGS